MQRYNNYLKNARICGYCKACNSVRHNFCSHLTDTNSPFTMQQDMIIHFTRPFDFSRQDILYIDNKPFSKCSEYISEHISEIKTLCRSYGFSFVFFGDYVRQIADDMTDEQRRYYFPSTEGLDCYITGADYMSRFVTEADKPLVQPAIFRFNHQHDQVKAWLLEPDEDIIEQFRSYLEYLEYLSDDEPERAMPPSLYEDMYVGESACCDDDVECSTPRACEAGSILPRFSVAADYLKRIDRDTADRNFSWEQEQMIQEIRERVERLRLEGIKEDILLSLIRQDVRLSKLVVTADYRILLPDYDNMEIVMSPLPKAVFLLFLRHEEGIVFKCLVDYRDELQQIYTQVSGRVSANVIDKSLDAVCDPTQNAINEKCARIREAFVSRFDERLARNYFVTGKRGEPKGITLPRDLVEWKSV